ncbi:MAG: efflux RND transporter periplasmic adaptor subunit [Stackebrandtia sp.]
MTREPDAEAVGEAPARSRRRRRLLPTAAVVVVAAAGAASWFTLRDSDAEPAGEADGPAATAEVVRTTISDTENWGGTLGHGSPFAVTASGQGVLTRVADQESKVKRGTTLYRLDEQPVTALYGEIPMYRDLASGDTGADVEQLEANLAKLGYGGFYVDDEFTWDTALAVRAWQDDVGRDATGAVAKSDVAFIPKGGRVDAIQAEVGEAIAPGTAVLEITGADQVVSLEIDVADIDLAAVGDDVAVGLPGGKEVAATVTAAAVVEDEADPDEEDEAAGADDTVAEVEVTLSEPADETLLGSPVDVVVNVDEREDVLVVPISALLALADGGYGLETVAADGTTSLVPVETGLFADGKVEVSGDGIDEGTVVGTAGR